MSVMCFRIFKRGEKEHDVLPTQCTLDLCMCVCVCVCVCSSMREYIKRERETEKEKSEENIPLLSSVPHTNLRNSSFPKTLLDIPVIAIITLAAMYEYLRSSVEVLSVSSFRSNNLEH